MEVVKLQKFHIKGALELIWEVFLEFESPDYSEEGVRTFREFIQYDPIIEKIEKGELAFWGCFMDCELTGVIAIKGTGHISLLFVKKEYQRRGIARKLFKTTSDILKENYGTNRITVNSSPYAVGVYHRLGFRDTNHELTINGIRFTPMECSIL